MARPNNYIMNRVLFLLLVINLTSCNSNEKHPITFEEINTQTNIPDGKYPGFIYFLDENFDTLKNLKPYSNVWIIMKDNNIEGFDIGKIALPGTESADKQGKKELLELKKIKFIRILGGENYDPIPITYDDLFKAEN